jgi:hypothetical protein
MAASTGGAPSIQASQCRAGWQTRRAAGDVREEVGSLGSGSASLFVAFVLPMLPPIVASLGTLYFGIITIPTSIYGYGDGDDSFCGGSHVRQIWDGHHLDPPERHPSEPEAPVEERQTGSFLCFIRFLRSCVRWLCVHPTLRLRWWLTGSPGTQEFLSP